ncbi:MAG TPA: TonB family protein [Stellaceae bacterium]|nr:TonB family protein [Stellaceae bacterium]
MQPSSGRSAPLIGAFGLALIIEAAAVAWFATALPAPTPAAQQAPMRVSLVTLPPAPPAPPPPVPAPPRPVTPPKPVEPPKPVPPKPAPPPKPVEKPQPVPKPRPHTRPKPKPVIHVPATAQASRAAVEAPPPQPVAPPPPAPPVEAASPDQLALFEGRLNQAVKEAVVYPAVARMMHLSGQARVAFTYLDGSVSDIRIVQSSGAPSIDKAAMDAVRTAVYPPPPGFLRHRSRTVSIWVVFNLAGDDSE